MIQLIEKLPMGVDVVHWRVCEPSQARFIIQFPQIGGEIEMWYLRRPPRGGYPRAIAVWKIKSHKS